MKNRRQNIIFFNFHLFPIGLLIISGLAAFPKDVTAQTSSDTYLEDALFQCLAGKFVKIERGAVTTPDRVRTTVQRDPSEHTRAFDSNAGRNFVYDQNKKAWIDTKTGECICPKCPPKPTTSKSPKKPVADTGKIDSCLVGKWRSESVTSDLMGKASKGEGAGILVTFKSDGTQTIDYNGMQPLKGATGETNQWSGTATGHISTSKGTAIIESVEQSELKHKLVAPDGTSSSNSMGSTLGPAGLVSNPLDRSYTCTKDTLTFKAPAHTFTFRRIEN